MTNERIERGPVHFMGVGGAGMCALAEAMKRAGLEVHGCDLQGGRAVERLRALGIAVHEGHHPDHVQGAAAVVASAALPPDHPELLAAAEHGITVYKRAAALGAWVRRGTTLAVAGTHGKTTTTAMLATVLDAAGSDPTAFVGGRVAAWGGNYRAGRDDLFVVEADEYDRSFLHLEPDVAVVTNLEADHLDIYGSLAGVEEGFRAFLARVRPAGTVVACADDPGAARVIQGCASQVVTYGLAAGSQLRATHVDLAGEGIDFSVVELGEERGRLRLGVPGMHNLRNALGAAAAARQVGLSWAHIAQGLRAFSGVGRRFDRLGEHGGVAVVDDYAHHPTEVTATLLAARAAYPGRRLVVAFQPHLYTRTQVHHRAFGAALAAADEVWVSEIYPAREMPIPGVSGEMVVSAVLEAGARAHFHAPIETLAEALVAAARPGDVILTLGAGSIETVGPELVDRLQGGGT